MLKVAIYNNSHTTLDWLLAVLDLVRRLLLTCFLLLLPASDQLLTALAICTCFAVAHREIGGEHY